MTKFVTVHSLLGNPMEVNLDKVTVITKEKDSGNCQLRFTNGEILDTASNIEFIMNQAEECFLID